MSEAFARLRALISPPAHPTERGSESQFAVVEAHLGLKLPPDYKLLIRTYGHGTWGGGLTLFNPFTQEVRFNLTAAVTGQLEEADHDLLFPEDAPFALYPEPGGLLPWGMTNKNDVLYWLTEGEPEAWLTVLYTRGTGTFAWQEAGCVPFLLQWLASADGVAFCPTA
jgi:hypothetical protein